MLKQVVIKLNMSNEIVNLTLPEFAFLEGSPHEKGGNPLRKRTVILHVRSATVIEIGDVKEMFPNDDVITYHFDYRSTYELEHLVAMVHYSVIAEGEVLEEILHKTAEWYCKYAEWEDENMDNVDSLFN